MQVLLEMGALLHLKCCRQAHIVSMAIKNKESYSILFNVHLFKHHAAN